MHNCCYGVRAVAEEKVTRRGFSFLAGVLSGVFCVIVLTALVSFLIKRYRGMLSDARGVAFIDTLWRVHTCFTAIPVIFVGRKKVLRCRLLFFYEQLLLFQIMWRCLKWPLLS